MTNQRAYVPAAGHDRWLKFYDPLTKLLGARTALGALIEQADLRPGQRVLEIGCGTGNLTVMLKQRRPQADVVALDPDPNALARARRKAELAGADIHWAQGFADAIPYPDASFDRVMSSFMLHHLPHDEKRAALVDVLRVLKAGGSFHVVDFAAPDDRRRGLFARMLHGAGHLHGNSSQHIVAMLDDVGFVAAAAVGTRRTLFGPIDFHRASHADGR